MPDTENAINPTVISQENAALTAFFQNRTLLLAQALANVRAERETLFSENARLSVRAGELEAELIDLRSKSEPQASDDKEPS